MPHSKRPARSDSRIEWFNADVRRRIRRFEERLGELGANHELMEKVRRAAGALAVPERCMDLHGVLRGTREGRQATTAVERVLVARRLPPELVAWAVWAALRGESLPVLAADYREEHVGPHATQKVEPVTGDAYFEIRLPADWSGKTIVAALPYLRDPSIFPGVPSAGDTSGGRPRAIEAEEAIELARRFDAEAASAGGDHTVKTWVAGWERWLKTELGPGPRPTAQWLWRTAVRPAIESGAFAPAAFEPRCLRRLCAGR